MSDSGPRSSLECLIPPAMAHGVLGNRYHFSWRVGYLKWPARDVLVNGFNSAWVKSRRDLMEGTRLGGAAAVHSRRDLTQPLSAYAGFVVVKAQGALSLEATDAVFCPTALFRRCVWVTARAGFFPGIFFLSVTTVRVMPVTFVPDDFVAVFLCEDSSVLALDALGSWGWEPPKARSKSNASFLRNT